jgi:hypothetical protein
MHIYTKADEHWQAGESCFVGAAHWNRQAVAFTSK